MRTTITISEDLLEEAMKLSGKLHYSEAVVTSLKDYVSLKKRLEFLELLFSKKLPHTLKKIKLSRKKSKWSS